MFRDNETGLVIKAILFHLVWTTAIYILFSPYYPVQLDQMLVAYGTFVLVSTAFIILM